MSDEHMIDDDDAAFDGEMDEQADDASDSKLSSPNWNPELPMGIRKVLLDSGFDPDAPREEPKPPTDEELLERCCESIKHWSTMPHPESESDGCDGCQLVSYDVVYRSKQPAVDGKVACSEYSAENGWKHNTHRAGMIKRCATHAEPAQPWTAELDPVKVRDWMRPQLGKGAFPIDFDDLKAKCLRTEHA